MTTSQLGKGELDKGAWQRIGEAIGTVDAVLEQTIKPTEKQEPDIMAEVKSVRQGQGKKRRQNK